MLLVPMRKPLAEGPRLTERLDIVCGSATYAFFHGRGGSGIPTMPRNLINTIHRAPYY